MPSNVQDVRLTLRNLFRSSWVNTEMPQSLDADDIHTGWYDGNKGFPQITVTHTEEGVIGGGNSGVTGIKGDGTGVTQHRNGTVTVNCWAGSSDDYANRGEEQVQAQAMADEVGRIVSNNVASVTDLTSIAVTTREKLVDTNEEPAEHRVTIEVTYNWQKQ